MKEVFEGWKLREPGGVLRDIEERDVERIVENLRRTEPNVCVRCQTWYWQEGKYCPDCVENPIFDRSEADLLGNFRDTYEFLGWKFRRTESCASQSNTYPKIGLVCYKRLFNPESAGEVYSFARVPDAGNIDLRLREAAAWQISHWFEHYLEICPCLDGERNDTEDSPFRRAVIEKLVAAERAGWKPSDAELMFEMKELAKSGARNEE